MMAEKNGYISLCPHCENYLPGRTFRRHREQYFNTEDNSWRKDPNLDSSSEDESFLMEIDQNHPTQSPNSSHMHSHTDLSDSEMVDDCHSLLNHEIWDEVSSDEIDEDTLDNVNVPSVDIHPTQRPSYSTLLNCLVVLLAYFWTYFPIPNNAMEFLLLSLKRFFETAAHSHNMFAAFALAFPGSLYLLRK